MARVCNTKYGEVQGGTGMGGIGGAAGIFELSIAWPEHVPGGGWQVAGGGLAHAQGTCSTMAGGMGGYGMVGYRFHGYGWYGWHGTCVNSAGNKQYEGESDLSQHCFLAQPRGLLPDVLHQRHPGGHEGPPHSAPHSAP